MKNLLFLLFPVFSFCQFSQNKDSLSINEKADKFARLVYSEYLKETEVLGRKFYNLYYVNKSDTIEGMKFSFFIVNKGENRDLNIPGTQEYRFDDIIGTYLDLFPIWNEIRKEYNLQPLNEDEKVKLSQKGGEFFDKNNYRIMFFKRRDFWRIELMKR